MSEIGIKKGALTFVLKKQHSDSYDTFMIVNLKWYQNKNFCNLKWNK